MKNKKTIKIAGIILAVIVLILIFKTFFPQILPSPTEHIVIRDIDKTSASVNEEITITLQVDVLDEDLIYAIEEILPLGVEIIDIGDASVSSNKLRWLEFSNPLTTTKTYKIKFVNSGTYTILGNYIFNDELDLEILGDSVIVVGSGTDTLSGDSSGNSPGGSSGPSSSTTPTSADSDMPCEPGETKQCGSGVGECKFGIQICSNNVFTSCEGDIRPVDEIKSDGKDNDCDGTVDEGFDIGITTSQEKVNLFIVFIIVGIILVAGVIVFLKFKK
tara:strand:- start:156 stop:977 length:822 start_codon:yes stop_codon:yes gene_type:complete